MSTIKRLILGLGILSLCVAGAIVPSFVQVDQADAAIILKGQTLTMKNISPTSFYCMPWGDNNMGHGGEWDATIGSNDFPVPCDGTFRALHARVDTATTQGSWTFTMIVNGVASDLEVVLNVGELDEDDWENTVDVEIGDMICFRSTADGAPTNLTYLEISYLFIPDTAGETIIWGYTGDTQYKAGYLPGSSVATVTQYRAADSGVFRRMALHLDSPPAGTAASITLYVNGAPTAMSITEQDGVTDYVSEVDVTVTKGLQLYWRQVADGHYITGQAGICYMSDTSNDYSIIANWNPAWETNGYIRVSGFTVNSHGTEDQCRMLVRNCKVITTYVTLDAVVGAGNQVVVTLYVNGVATSHSVTINPGASAGEITTEYELDDLDEVCWRRQTTGGAGYTWIAMVVENQNATGYVGDLTDFIATPISSTEIKLNWYNGIDPLLYPELMVQINRKQTSYPQSPPSTDSTQIYYQAPVQGNCEYIDMGLSPGTTYYYRIWLYDTDTECYELCDQDWATTYAGGGGGDDIDEPTEWNQTPRCDIFNNWFIGTPMNATADGLGIPRETVCVLSTLLLIGMASAVSFVPAKLSGMQSSRTVAIPFLVMGILMVVAAIAHAIPLNLMAIAVLLGGSAVYLWTRV